MPSPLFLLPYRAHAPPSTSNSTDRPCRSDLHTLRSRTRREAADYGYRYCFICLLPSVTAVDGHEVYLRRKQSPAASTFTSIPTDHHEDIHTTARVQLLSFFTSFHLCTKSHHMFYTKHKLPSGCPSAATTRAHSYPESGGCGAKFNSSLSPIHFYLLTPMH